MHPATRHAQSGSTLFEVLVAFLVLSLGLVAIARLQGHLRLDADVARQRSEAVRLAQADMETLRGFASVADAPGLRSFESIAGTSRTVSGSTTYRLDREITATTLPQARAASITVRWADRSGTAQHTVLHSIITGTDPMLSGALALPAPPAR